LFPFFLFDFAKYTLKKKQAYVKEHKPATKHSAIKHEN